MTIDEYYIDPNHCLKCSSIIHPKRNNNKYNIAAAKAKSFCNRECYLNDINDKRSSNILIKKYGHDFCGCGELKKKKSLICKKCVGSGSIEDRTYSFYKNKYKDWWSARVPISKDARKKYSNSDKPKCCVKCGYDKNYQVCHIKAVSEFDENTLIKEINNINNLIALCPNCHWEFDNGLFKI